MYGMPAGMAELLRRKYDLIQQDADTAKFNAQTNRLGTDAQARLDMVRAGLLPAESAANINKLKADTAMTAEQTKFVGPLARSSMELNSANAFQSRASGGLYGEQADQLRQLNKMMPGLFGGMLRDDSGSEFRFRMLDRFRGDR